MVLLQTNPRGIISRLFQAAVSLLFPEWRHSTRQNLRQMSY